MCESVINEWVIGYHEWVSGHARLLVSMILMSKIGVWNVLVSESEFVETKVHFVPLENLIHHD